MSDSERVTTVKERRVSREKFEKHIAECRASNHSNVSWHWADGRPRKTCGFCGDVLDHTSCKRCSS